METSPRLVVLVILLIFFFFNPDQGSVQRFRLTDVDQLAETRQADFDVIANSTYGELESNGLGLKGFRIEDGYQWDILGQVKNLVRTQQMRNVKTKNTSFYRRLDADIRGRFTRNNIRSQASHQLNLTAVDPHGYYISHVFQRNVTENECEINLSLKDYKVTSELRDITASVAIYADSAPGTGWEGSLRGIHFPDGSVILTTSSEKFNALPALPHFALGERAFNRSRTLINSTLTRAWEQSLMHDLPVATAPSCELVVWLHQKPIQGSARYITQIETELEKPEGAPIGTPPPIAFAALIFSPDCGYVYQADTVYGPKMEVYWGLVQRLLVAFITIVALEIALLKRQMERCATPSTRARISYYSIGIAAFGDGLILFAIVGLLMVENGAFTLLAASAFLCCMHVAFFEVKFVFDIWTVQVGEPAQAQRERERRSATTATSSINDTGGLPLPATTPTSDPRAPAQVDLGIETPRATFASLYSRFYFALINLMFFSLWAMSWPPNLRSAYFNTLSFCYFSMWIPQIYRNVMRNCRKALDWEYVLGTSVLRAIPILYWYLDDRNVLAAKASPETAWILVLWLGGQLLVLSSQQYLGPRLLVRDSWCPPAYDYHPVLSDDLESRGMPIGEVASASEGKDIENKSRRVFDCAICMNEIDVPVISKDESNGRSWLEQKDYMVTPCRHIFHSECLEGWMNLRLVCPVCREGLPPL